MPRIARLVAARLRRARWTLAAGVASTLAVFLVGEGSWLFLAAAVLAMFAVAAITPRRHVEKSPLAQEPAAERQGMGGLSAEALADAVDEPLILFDGAGGVIHANRAAVEAFGVVDRGLPILLKFRAPEVQAAIGRVLAGAPSAVVDHADRIPVERAYRITISTVEGGSGLFVLSFKDQSEARRIDRMRADFIANASHELRTPLASIAGFIETLRGPARNDDAARERFLGIMHDQTGRMARLIDDLLSLSRIEMKPYLPPGARADVRQVVESVIDTLGPLARESGVVIERELADIPSVVRGDRDELFQVFQNLLENACKYGSRGGRVIVSSALEDVGGKPGLAVTVRDFGPGIPADHIPRITERFYRVDVETSRAQKGTGLGLSIVKHILTRHNGRLTIRSEVGEGASFTVHLPLG